MGEKRDSWLPVSCMTGCNESQEKVWFLKKKKKIKQGLKEAEIPFKLTFVHPRLRKGYEKHM